MEMRAQCRHMRHYVRPGSNSTPAQAARSKPVIRLCLRLLLLASLACQPPFSFGRVPQPAPEDVVARVNGEPITAARLDAEIRGQLTQLEDQERRLRQTILLKLIDNLLLEQAARKEGASLEDYLRRHVERVAVSDQEVAEAYQRSRDRFLGALAPEAKYRIRRDLEDHRRSDTLRRLLERLRREATVTNHLLEGAVADLAAGPAPSLGSPGAPVNIVEFCDFQCAFCRQAQPVIRQALAKWGPKARLVFRHFPLPRHPHAFEAAKAAACAEQQGRFWEVHQALFTEGQDLSTAGLAALARASNLREADFTECLKDTGAGERVRRDIELGRKAGVDGTPAIFVNGRRIADVGQLDAAIQEALRQSGQPEAAEVR